MATKSCPVCGRAFAWRKKGARLGECEVLLRALSPRTAAIRLRAESGAAMSALRIILGDQLSFDVAALSDLVAGRDTVLMMEVTEENTYVRHHKQKIALVLSAMRHFADALRQRGVRVDYVELDAPGNTGSLTTEVQRAVPRHRPSRIVVTEPSEWRVQAQVEGWSSLTGAPVEVRADHRYFASRARFADWARGRRVWRMEHFYHEMRREHEILMEGEQPAGGEWNYDSANRKRLPAGAVPPARLRFRPDETTHDVTRLVERCFPRSFRRA